MSNRVAVVGLGAVGTTATYDLARAGVDVTAFDRGDVASGSSGRASGIVYDAFAEDVDARIATRALERFRYFSGDGEFRLHETPYLWFATEPGDTADAIAEQVAGMQRHDRDVERVDRDWLASNYPSLDWDDVEVAAVANDAATATPADYCDLLAEKAETAGADLRTDTEVTVATDPLRVDGERYDSVLVATGAHTKQVLATAGFSVPLKPYRVQALVTGGPAIPTIYDATAGYYARPHQDGILAGDGTVPVEADPDDYDRDGDDDFVAETTRNLEQRLVNFDASVDRAWAGLCVATPDRDPLLGELEDGLYVAAGWQGHGFMRAPATGEQVAKEILGERDGLRAFDPTRFSGDEEFEIVEGMAYD